jgi:molybdopterin molybdotransferase
VSEDIGPVDWEQARQLAYAAGREAAGPAELVSLPQADGRTLAEPLRALTDLPAFATSSIDGWAVRGPQPWRPVGRVLAGGTAAPLDATDLRRDRHRRDGPGRRRRADPRRGVHPRRRRPGQRRAPRHARVAGARRGGDTRRGAAAGRHRRRPGRDRRGRHLRLRELARTPGPARRCWSSATSCSPRHARRRPGPRLARPADAGWLRRCGADGRPGAVAGPVRDTLDAHLDAIRGALDVADVVCTTGGTMHGPVDHLHPALAELGAEYVVNTVAVRPGFPMLLARVPGPDGRPRSWPACPATRSRR